MPRRLPAVAIPSLPMSRAWQWAVAGLLLTGSAVVSPLSALAAPPELKSLFPTAVGRGESIAVQAEGTFAKWPPEFLIAGTGVTIQPGEKQGELQVTVAEDAEVGVHLVRVADAGGISAARPLVVGTLPSLTESEPNNANGEAQMIPSSSVVNGKLDRGGEVDTYRVPLKEGQTLVASLRAHNVLGSPMDGVLQVADSAGFALAQNDDARGLDPLLIFQAPADAEYLVRVFAFPETPNSSISFAGGADYVYQLTLTTQPFVDFTLPLAASANQPVEVELGGWNVSDAIRQLSLPAAKEDAAFVTVARPEAAGWVTIPVLEMPSLLAAPSTLDQPQPLELPCSVTGRLTEDGQSHVFQLAAKKGEAVRIRTASYELGYPLDPQLRVLDESGKVVSEVDDVSSDRDAALTFRPPADGIYRVVVRDLHGRGGPRFVYRLVLEPAQPRYNLTLQADAFTLQAGKPLEIPVTVERLDGFAEAIQISAAELPDGVTAEPVTSEAKGDSAKQVKLKLTSDKPFETARFRVVGQVGERRTVARYDYPRMQRQAREFLLKGVE